VHLLLVQAHSHRYVIQLIEILTSTFRCVKTLKSLGFTGSKGAGTKISIQSLTKDKIKKLSNLRVIQKTLVYVIGLAPEIANEEKLKSVEYFGQYGNL